MAERSPLTPRALERAFTHVLLDPRAAQRRMEPLRRGPRPPGSETKRPRNAAALAYVFERAGWLWLPLTVRGEDLPEHGGQVSLPGGRPRAGESLEATARREAQEEIGLAAPELRWLGRLAPVDIPVSHTRLHVLVALGPDPGALRADPREVERVVLVSLDELADPERRRHRPWWVAGRELDVPYFDVEGLFLWGATAMALAELVERVSLARALPD